MDVSGVLLGSKSSQLVRDGAGSARVCEGVCAGLRCQPCRLQSVTPSVHPALLGTPLPVGRQLSKQSRADGMILLGQGPGGAVT